MLKPAKLLLVIALIVGSTVTHSWGLLPASYDLRTAGPYSWITPTKNQGELGTCWAFASTTAFQSSLLRAGLVTNPVSTELDQSLWHLATRNGRINPDLTAPYDGWGGDNNFTEGYLTRGRGSWGHSNITYPAGGGFVPVGANPLNVYPLAAAEAKQNLAPFVPPADQPGEAFRLRGSFNYADTTVGAPPVSYRDTLKQAILDRGALSVTMFAGTTNVAGEDFDDYFNTTHFTYQVTGSGATNGANHMVAIAGWDDNKAVYNAAGTQISTGAWLVQNSWGASFGTNGYFWMAYDDPIATKTADSFEVGTSQVTNQPGLTITDTVLQNGIYAPETKAGNLAGNQTLGASKLMFSDALSLVAIGIWTQTATTEVTLSLYDSWSSGPAGALLFSNSFTLEGIGYKEMDFTALDFNAGDDVYVQLDFGTLYDSPLSIDSFSLGLTNVGSFTDLSWIGDGTNWTDLSTYSGASGVLFTKGITAVPEPGTVGLLALSGAVCWLMVRRRR